MKHRVVSIDFKGPYMLLRVDEEEYKIDLRTQSKKLSRARDRIRRNFVVSPAAYGIHWPDIDEDLSINGLILSTKRNRARKAKK